MFLNEFHSVESGTVKITPKQASRFAKEVADDFNPIHDADSKRFCVPGDLLFSLVLALYGISEHMRFRFTGMVGEGTDLVFAPTDASEFVIADANGKAYLEVERSGEISRDESAIDDLARGYVAFSGRNFPHVLVPLMAEHDVMINPDRPLVIYESMSFDLEHLQVKDLSLEAAASELAVKGKRGEAVLRFRIMSGSEQVGEGCKKLLLSGLRPFEASVMEGLSREYESWKAAYKQAD